MSLALKIKDPKTELFTYSIQFRDSYPILGAPLAQICKDFKLNVVKGDIDHEHINLYMKKLVQ